MDALPVARKLPPTFHVESDKEGVLAVRADLRETFRAKGFGPGGGGQLHESELHGGRAPLSELRDGDERFVVRHFRHGGLTRWFTGSRYADPSRPFEELVLSEELAAAGIATARVAAARAYRAVSWLPGGLTGWRLDLVTRRIEGVSDLAELLEALRGGEVPAPWRAHVVHAVGRFIGELHRFGLAHADLTPRNVLLAAEALRAPASFDAATPVPLWIIDLDRSKRHVPLSRDAGRENLRRFLRAVLRRNERGRAFLTRGDVGRFLRGYDEALGRSETAWREDWRAIAARELASSRWHRFAWWLETLFGGGADTRDGRAVVREPGSR